MNIKKVTCVQCGKEVTKRSTLARLVTNNDGELVQDGKRVCREHINSTARKQMAMMNMGAPCAKPLKTDKRKVRTSK